MYGIVGVMGGKAAAPTILGSLPRAERCGRGRARSAKPAMAGLAKPSAGE